MSTIKAFVYFPIERICCINTLKCMFLTLTRSGGSKRPSPKVFLSWRWTIRPIALKLSVTYGVSFPHFLVKQNWSGHVRSRSYDVIRGTASDPFWTKSVYTPTWRDAVDWKVNILGVLGNEGARWSFWRRHLAFSRSTEVTRGQWPRIF